MLTSHSSVPRVGVGVLILNAEGEVLLTLRKCSPEAGCWSIAGGKVIGVIPQHLVDREVAHAGLSGLRVVKNMAERKAVMAEQSDVFVALPGGYGTLDDLFEMVTWTQIGVQAKPCGVLNVTGYYNSLLAWVDHAVGEGPLRPGHRALLLADGDPAVLLYRLGAWTLPEMPKLA